MEANKDEAERCLEQARYWRSQERIVKALKFATKSQQLYPSPTTAEFIQQLERERDGNNHPNMNNTRTENNEQQRTDTENNMRTNTSSTGYFNAIHNWNIDSYLPNSLKNLKIVDKYKQWIILLTMINICLLLYRFVYLNHPIDWFASDNYTNNDNDARNPNRNGSPRRYHNNDHQFGNGGSSFILIPFGGFYISGGFGRGFGILCGVVSIFFMLLNFLGR